MDVIILIAVIVLFVFLFKKTFSSFVYAVAVTDIFFRIVTYLKIKLTNGYGSLYAFLDNNIPSNIPAVIEKYTNYEFSFVLIWAYVILMIVFEFYAIRTFMHKK